MAHAAFTLDRAFLSACLGNAADTLRLQDPFECRAFLFLGFTCSLCHTELELDFGDVSFPSPWTQR